MVVVERKQVGRLLIFLLLAAALTWYVLSKRVDFYRAAYGTPAEAPAVPVTAPAAPATASTAPSRETAFPTADPLAEGRLARARARSLEMETLRALAESPRTGDAARQEAALKLVELTELARKEADIEVLLKAKNFADALVLLHKDHADVVVRSATDFGREEAAAVIDAVVRATGLRGDRVAVVSRP